MSNAVELDEFHWLLAITQSIDVGVVVLGLDGKVEVWNTFMENRSGLLPRQAVGQNFFELFPEIDRAWFSKKMHGVATLGTPAFTVWEQRPYLLRFKNYQPITGQEAFMFQNTTLTPLRSIRGDISHLCLVIYDVTNVATQSRQLHASHQQLQTLLSADHLTGLYNRGHWEDAVRHEFARHQRYGHMAALMMLDIDHFKRINDEHGHLVGDRVIRAVADTLREHVREADIPGRYGGEEYAVLLPDTDSEGARVLAERLREAIEGLQLAHQGQGIAVTVSIGVADLGSSAADCSELIEWADRALYASKRAGRNRVSVYTPG
ncbi:diguanylate cyclase [Pseudomonas sp. nanlin1]|uniref:sensor domain-containing diguanylate cyclase n=1 Tax=Pseudomonas sp. nanlin1 TaxID=3040605 RepID=UPI00388D3F7B